MVPCVFVILLGLQAAAGQLKPERQAPDKHRAQAQDTAGAKPLTYAGDVAPIVRRYCLPCHLAENDNPSGLSLDNYETILKGGEHGNVLVRGKATESNLYLKLLSPPPFGKQMPRSKKKLTDAEIKVIFDWINQGAKKQNLY